MDTVYGGSGDDSIDGGDRTDIIYGGSGNDLITDTGGTTSDDTMYGGDGDDTVYGGTREDTIFGDAGHDRLWGDAGDDRIDGGDGNDLITGGVGNDSLTGGLGDDTIAGDDGNDTVYGNDGNDSISSSSGNDLIYAGTGDDTVYISQGSGTLYGEAGNDTLQFGYNGSGTMFGGAGNDSLLGYAGNDILDGGTGDDYLRNGGGGIDTLSGGDGSDTFAIGMLAGTPGTTLGTPTIYGGEADAGIDTVSFAPHDHGITVTYTGSEAANFTDGVNTGQFSGIEAVIGTGLADIIYGGLDTAGLLVSTGAGDDAITGGTGADMLFGGAGNDSIAAGAGNDTLYGGAGNDTLSTGAGNDTAYGEAGDDTLSGDDGNDTLFGGDGTDSVNAGAGNDTVFGDSGNDVLFGGTGDDILSGGTGQDMLRGGVGNDLLTLGAGNDGIAMDRFGGADMVTDFSLTDTDADGHYDDQIDVSDLTNGHGGPVTAWNVVVTDDGHGNALLTFPEGETLILQGVSPSQMSTAQQRYAAGIPCFTAGTLILTPRGEMPVQDLRPGDTVITMDNGIQPVVWAASRQIGGLELMAAPRLLPVRLTRAFTGSERQLLVSPQHGVLVRRQGAEVLARAAHLARLGSGQARVAKGVTSVHYVHLMFANHQIIWSNGVPSESFYPGGWGLSMLDPATLLSLARTFPRLALLGATAGYGPTARPALRMADLRDDIQGFPRVARCAVAGQPVSDQRYIVL